MHDLGSKLAEIVGPSQVFGGDDIGEHYRTDITGKYSSAPSFMVRPDSTGSIAAEHGIGVARAPYLPWTRSPQELALMRSLKQTLDPAHILNPEKLLDAL